jgi:hypothetical protein
VTRLAGVQALAVDGLLAARNAEGWWEDFTGPIGPSDEWVTAYVAMALAGEDHRAAQAAARAGWRLLLGRRGSADGWGYNARSPGDADSTDWGLRLAAWCGAGDHPRAQAARRFVEAHMRPDGSVITYLPGTFTPPGADGWALPHVCVTAGMAAVPGFEERCRNYLAGVQQADGSWRNFWSPDHDYATALSAEALSQGTPEQRALVPAAVRWGLERLAARGAVVSPERPGGSPFATAWCLRLLVLGGESDTVHAAAVRTPAWLIK